MLVAITDANIVTCLLCGELCGTLSDGRRMKRRTSFLKLQDTRAVSEPTLFVDYYGYSTVLAYRTDQGFTLKLIVLKAPTCSTYFKLENYYLI